MHAILEFPVIEKILKHFGLQAQPPPRAPAREPGRISRAEPHPPLRHTGRKRLPAGARVSSGIRAGAVLRAVSR